MQLQTIRWPGCADHSSARPPKGGGRCLSSVLASTHQRRLAQLRRWSHTVPHLDTQQTLSRGPTSTVVSVLSCVKRLCRPIRARLRRRADSILTLPRTTPRVGPSAVSYRATPEQILSGGSTSAVSGFVDQSKADSILTLVLYERTNQVSLLFVLHGLSYKRRLSVKKTFFPPRCGVCPAAAPPPRARAPSPRSASSASRRAENGADLAQRAQARRGTLRGRAARPAAPAIPP